MVELACLGRNVGLDVLDVLFNAFPDDLLTHNSVEEDVKLNDDSFQVVLLVGVLFSDEEPVLLFEDVLDLADYVGSPDDFPVFLRVQ